MSKPHHEPDPSLTTDWQGHLSFLRRLAYGVLNDMALADDVVQEAWLVQQKESSPRGRAWWAGVVKNLARNRKRQEDRRRSRELRAARGERWPSAEESLERVEILERVVAAVRTLDEPYRTVVLWRFFDERSIEEIARERGCPENTVRTQVRRGLERLRERLRTQGFDEQRWLGAILPGLSLGKVATVSAFSTTSIVTAFLMSTKAKVAVAITLVAAGSFLISRQVDTRARQTAEASVESIDEPGSEAELLSASSDDEATSDAVGERTPIVEEAAPLDARLAALLKSRRTIFGTVTNVQGEPVEGASVWVSGQEPVTTAADGSYRLETKSLGSYMSAYAPGYAQQQAQFGPLGTEDYRQDFQLKSEFVVQGTVVDRKGKPIEGVSIRAFYGNEHFVLSDALGRYRLDRLDPGRPEHLVLATKEGYVFASHEVATLAGEVGVQDFELDAGVRVEGRVVDEAGNPVADAELFIGASRYHADKVTAKSRADGRFEFASVQRGSQQLAAEFTGFSFYSQPIDVPLDRDRLGGLEIVMRKGAFLGGRVFDEAGKALEGVSVAVRCNGNSLRVRGTTDHEGRFRLENLPDGELRLRFFTGRHRLQELWTDVEALNVDDLQFTMLPAAGLAGKVVDDATGKPLTEFTVRFVGAELMEGDRLLSGYNAEWARRGRRFQNAEGHWDTGRESEWAPGRVMGIEVTAPGYAPARAPRVVATLEMLHEDNVLRVRRGVAIDGKVQRAENGLPLEDALVKLYRADESVSHHSDDTHGRRLTNTDSSGRFRFEGVEPGSYRVLAIHGTRPGRLCDSFDVLAGSDASVTVELVDGARIDGVLRDARGHARLGVTVRATLQSGGTEHYRREWETKTDDAGQFSFEGLPGGTLQVGPSVAEGFAPLRAFSLSVHLEVGEQVTLDLKPRGTASLAGTLSSQDDLPESLPIRVTELGADARSGPGSYTTVAMHGTFRVDGLPPGRYSVTAQWREPDVRRTWHSTEEIELELTAGATEEAVVPVAVR